MKVSLVFGNTVKTNKDFQRAPILQRWTVYKHREEITDYLSIQKESRIEPYTEKVFGKHYYSFCILNETESSTGQAPLVLE